MPPEPRTGAWRSIALAAALYTALTLAFFAPSLARTDSALIGPPEDNMQFHWFQRYGADALADPHKTLMRTTDMYYPGGITLYYANYYYYGVFITAALRPLLHNDILIFNLLVLHTFPAAALAGYALTRHFTGDTYGALIGGYIFGFNPAHFAHALHHVTIATVHFVPLYILFTLRALRDGRKRDIAGAAASLALGALCDWNYLVFGIVFAALIVVYRMLKERTLLPLRSIGIVAASGLLAAAALSPLLWPMIRIGLTTPFKNKLPGHDIFVADLLGYVIPHTYHLTALWEPVRRINTAMTGTDWEKPVYLGLANLALAAWALPRLWRTRRSLLAAWAAFAVLALGVSLHIYGRSVAGPLPYAVLEKLPFLENARNPSRIIQYAYAFWAVIVALALKDKLSALTRPIARKIAAAVIAALIFVDFYSISSAMTPVELPPCYAAVVEDPDRDFGVLDVPYDMGRYQLYQLLHKRPIVQGYIGRRVEDVLNDKLVYDLKRLPLQKLQLKAAKVKYVIIHKRKMEWDPADREDRAYWLTLTAVSKAYERIYTKVYEDAAATVFRVY